MSGFPYGDGLVSGHADAVEISAAHRFQVMAVDDQPEVLTALKRILRGRGFDVHPCLEPHEALATIEADPFRYDLLMLDVSMPAMSGLELLPRIKEVAPALPVIMLTADDRAQTDDQTASQCNKRKVSHV